MRFWEKLKKRLNDLDEFDKFFINTLLIAMIIVIFIGIFFPGIFEGLLEWISETFSVPLIQDKAFHIDAQGILLLFIMVIILLSCWIHDLIRSRVREAKKGKIRLKRK